MCTKLMNMHTYTNNSTSIISSCLFFNLFHHNLYNNTYCQVSCYNVATVIASFVDKK